MQRILTTLAFGLAFAAPVMAEGPKVTDYDGSFDDATFAVESAIVGQGLVIDYVSHVGDMLNRTGSDVGSDVQLFENAQIFVFCSAVVSRQVMEADPMNLAHCPYGIFVSEGTNGVQVGYRDYPRGSMQAVEDLLAGIVAEAVGD
ncbi:DUF302 domain-containing protein [Shimia ponticola]|uniref:DUF302 domain-containing protein n=1 Tax=Shimia ponticola TaxID=2582893 RepID=UPI0011BF53A8